MSALQWKVSMVNNVAELTVSVRQSPSYPADMLDEFMKQILYLDVKATYDEGTVTRRFSSNGGTYSLEKTPDGTAYRLRWDVTLLNGIQVGSHVKFEVHCYYDTGFGTMDSEVLKTDISGENQIYKAPGSAKFEAAYALQDLLNKYYVTIGQATAEDSWSTGSASTPGKIPFFELSLADNAEVEATDWNGIQLNAEGLSYANSTSTNQDTTWWPLNNLYHKVLMKFYRETGGMKLQQGANLNYAFKKVGYYTVTDPLTAEVETLIPSMTHTSSVRGLDYLDYLISCGSQNLLTKSDQTIYLKLYDITDRDNPKDVTGEAKAKITSLNPEAELQTGTNSEGTGGTYYKWKLTDSVTDYRIRFYDLKPGHKYAMEAYAYPDNKSGGIVTTGSFTAVVDAGAEQGSVDKVVKNNTNYQLETQKSVTLKNVRASYINKSYQQKGLEINFQPDVYEGYKIACYIYKTPTNNQFDDSLLVYSNEDLKKQYTSESNAAYTDSNKYADYNYLEKTTSYVAGDNTFWIPFPPSGNTKKLPGGENYTVVLRAVDENGNVLNTTDADRQETFEFISDGIAVSKSASYAITSTGRASVDSNNKNVLNLTLLASDPLYQIVDDKYYLFVKQIKDSNGNSVTGKILGMNADGELYWMTSENGTGAVKATDVTLGGDGSTSWKQDIKVADTTFKKEITLTGVPSGTYEIYTVADIDLDADGRPETSGILTSFKKTVQTVTDSVTEGHIYASTVLADGKWKLVLRFSGWENLDKVSSAMCLITNSDLTYQSTFADLASSLIQNKKIELVLDNAPSGDYVVTLNMTTQKNGIEQPVTLKNRDITFTIN